MGLDWFGADYLHIMGAYGVNIPIDIYKGVEGDPITDGIEMEWQVMTGRDDLIAPDPAFSNDDDRRLGSHRR
jgi:hypothetical protein